LIFLDATNTRATIETQLTGGYVDATSILEMAKPALDVLSTVRSWFQRDKHFAVLKFVPDVQQNFWSEGTIDGKPATMLHGFWYVTNIGPARNVHVLQVHTRWPHVDGHLFPQVRPPLPLAPGIDFSQPVQCSAYIAIPGLVGQRGKPIKKTIVFVDQFNHRHRVRTVFRSVRPA